LRRGDCDEAARDILLTGIRPRRSIRFVLFTGGKEDMPGSWRMCARTVRNSTALAPQSFPFRMRSMTGYSLNGRHDIESSLGEAMKPVESLGAGHYLFDAALGTTISISWWKCPSLTAIQQQTGALGTVPIWHSRQNRIAVLKRNTAIVAVTASDCRGRRTARPAAISRRDSNPCSRPRAWASK